MTLILIVYAENAFALSGKRRSIENQSCYINAVNNGTSKQLAKAYCNCVAKKLDGKYTDNQLDALVDKGFDYIIDAQMGLLYVKPQYDMTDDVLHELRNIKVDK